jgi:hypothetical protein
MFLCGINQSIRFLTCENMTTLVLSPDLGVPITPDIPYLDLRERAAAACAAAEALGLDTTPTIEDNEAAQKLVSAYAADPENTSKQVTTKRASSLPPAVLQQTRQILDEWAQKVVQNSIEIRHLVVNKLITESENPDPRVRIRALELLGKISDVGLFTEKHEVTITHQTTDDLKLKLREKLSSLRQRTVDAEVTDVTPTIDGEVIDLDEELGLNDESDDRKSD